jgi:hypothetical protein
VDVQKLSEPADVTVNADPDKSVQALTPIYGTQVTTAASALTTYNLIFGEGVMTFDPPQGNTITGNFDMGGGYVLDLKDIMQTSASGDISYRGVRDRSRRHQDGQLGVRLQGVDHSEIAERRQSGSPARRSVIRTKPQDGGAAGVVASFIAIKE